MDGLTLFGIAMGAFLAALMIASAICAICYKSPRPQSKPDALLDDDRVDVPFDGVAIRRANVDL